MSFKDRYLLYMKIISNKKKKIKNFTIKILIIFLTLIHTDFFINSYLIILKKYEARLESNYGYCEKQGYGFLKKFENKYKLTNNSKIIFNNQKYPNPGIFLNQFNSPKTFDYIIYINSKKIPSDKKILEQEYNCYIVKND